MLEIFKISQILRNFRFFSAFLTYCIITLFFDLRARIWGQTTDLNFFIQNLSKFKNKYWFSMWFLKKKLWNASKKFFDNKFFFLYTAYFVFNLMKQFGQPSLLLLIPSLLRRKKEKFHELTDFERRRIIDLQEGGFSYRAISIFL